MFMEGTIPAVTTFISKVLKLTLDEKSENLVESYIADGDEKKVELAMQKKDNLTIVKKFGEEFRKFRQGKLINPVLKVVRTLPKEEMAAMAEALVELTALRRNVDSHLESVGGPTDVAVISKGDGFIWIKRKHYFKMEMNEDFVRRKSNNRERTYEAITVHRRADHRRFAGA